MSESTDVNSYISNCDEKAHPTLQELREVITSAVPEAEEKIKYNVPFYEFYGTHVGFSAAKEHATVGIGADALRTEDRNMLEEKGYKTGKETIRIRYDQSIPVKEIRRLLREKAENAKNDSEHSAVE